MYDDFTVFEDAYNLPLLSPQVTNGENGQLGAHAVDHNNRPVIKGLPFLDDVKPDSQSNAS